MEGQFLVRQIYEDEITYNLINAAEEVLREFLLNLQIPRLNKRLLKTHLFTFPIYNILIPVVIL
jgi:hypothetical protein